jgi:chromosome partition protein MukF
MDFDRDFARLRTTGVSLALTTADLCCLLVIRVHEADSAALLERDVLDLLTNVHDQFPDADNPRRRAVLGLQRLREQRMLTLVSMGGLARQGEFSLSGLGRAVVDFFVEDARLTKESLKVLTATLASQLARVRDAARAADSAEAWDESVVVPITVASRSLLEGIERRTRGLDADQEAVRADIARLLTERWLDAMEQAQALLEDTTARLEELRDVILEEQKGLDALLTDIEALAADAGATRAERAATELGSDLARLAGWAMKRHEEWSAYYQSMLQTLRSLVRLDPDRALTQRLRDTLQAWPDSTWTLAVAPRLRIRVLRPVEHVVERPPVERDHKAEGDVSRVPPTEAAPLEALVTEAVRAGASTLGEVLTVVLPAVPAELRYRDAGRVAEILAKQARVRTPLERDWVNVRDELWVEDWGVERLKEEGE